MFKDILNTITQTGLLSDETDEKYIKEYDEQVILDHCVEEMAECIAAIKKYLRINNPSAPPTASELTKEEVFNHLKEEMADALSMGFLACRKLECVEEVCDIHIQKSIEFISRM